jgi:PAS domain S-box-containing protein
MEISEKNILLVEDEAIIALTEKKQLEGAGYGVTHAASGEAAIEAIEAGRGSGFDLVLMDIDLGRGMAGTEAARRILRIHDIPLLFLSSHTEPEIVRSTELISNYGYVVKSSSFTVLDASIKMALKLFAAQERIKRVNANFEAANEELRLSLERLQDSNRELALSNEKFSKIFQANPDYVAISRLDDGTYLDVNEGFVEMMGYAREEVVGRSALSSSIGIWADPADRRLFTKLLMRDKKVSSFRANLVRKDGSSFAAVASARMLEIDATMCLIAVVKDLGAGDLATGRAGREST